MPRGRGWGVAVHMPVASKAQCMQVSMGPEAGPPGVKGVNRHTSSLFAFLVWGTANHTGLPSNPHSPIPHPRVSTRGPGYVTDILWRPY